MMSINTRFKAAILAACVLVAGNASAISFNSFSPKKVASLALVAMWIRLRTKGSTFEYKMSDWSEDVRSVMEDYNIFEWDLYKKVVDLFDKYAIGRQVSIIDVTYRSKNDDGTIVALKDKKLKCKPFGLMGLLDAYVIMQLEHVGKILTNWDSADKLFAKLNGDAVVVTTTPTAAK